MIRPLDNKPVDLSDEEWEYCKAIVVAFGLNVFQNTFEVIESEQDPHYGWITIVKPPMSKNLPMGVIFALFNIMLNQRTRRLDDMLTKFEAKIGK